MCVLWSFNVWSSTLLSIYRSQNHLVMPIRMDRITVVFLGLKIKSKGVIFFSPVVVFDNLLDFLRARTCRIFFYLSPPKATSFLAKFQCLFLLWVWRCVCTCCTFGINISNNLFTSVFWLKYVSVLLRQFL